MAGEGRQRDDRRGEAVHVRLPPQRAVRGGRGPLVAAGRVRFELEVLEPLAAVGALDDAARALAPGCMLVNGKSATFEAHWSCRIGYDILVITCH